MLFDFHFGGKFITGDLEGASLENPKDFYDYKLGAIYAGYGNFRYGVNSQEIRKGVQNYLHNNVFSGSTWMLSHDDKFYDWIGGGTDDFFLY